MTTRGMACYKVNIMYLGPGVSVVDPAEYVLLKLLAPCFIIIIIYMDIDSSVGPDVSSQS